MVYIVHGATGAQGFPVLSALTAAGCLAKAAVRDTSKMPNAAAVAVDYRSADSLAAAYEGAEGVFIHLPIGRREDQIAYAQAIGEAIRLAKPGRVVFSTSGYRVEMTGDGTSPADVMVRELAKGDVSHAIVEPRLYLENLLLPVTFGPAREEGLLHYPLREDYITSWSSHLDVADVVVRLLVDHSVTGIVSVGALPGLVGADLAMGFSRYLGAPIRFKSIAPDQYGQLITPLFGSDAAIPVVESYKHRQTQLGEPIPEDRSAQKLLGLTPRSVEQWLRDVMN